MLILTNKVAVVTGASGGIGATIARTLARQGADVVVNYCRSEESAQQIVDTITEAGGKATAIHADVSKRTDIETLLEKTMTTYGNIDIWVNNAGADILTGNAKTHDVMDKLHALLAVDLQGTIMACQAVVPHMTCGAIINITWDLALHGFAGTNPQLFAAVKAGVQGFSQCLAKTVAPQIRVNTVAPGWIETKFARDVMAAEYYQERLSEIPLGRFGRAQDVANAVCYLASDEASYVTGQMLKINGGLV